MRPDLVSTSRRQLLVLSAGAGVAGLAAAAPLRAVAAAADPTAISSARLYWESHLAFFPAKGVTLPVAVSAFRDELYQAPRSWAEKAYPNLVFYAGHDRGGHFAAWEQPAALTADLRAAFRPLRTA